MKRILSISLALAVSYFGIMSSADAQEKHDIEGFYPGMNASEFLAVLKQHNLSCGGTMVPGNQCYSSCAANVSAQQCVADDDSNGTPSFSFEFSDYLATKTLWIIRYYFYGVKPSNEMIDSISAAFNNHGPQTRQIPGQLRPTACGELVDFMGRIALWKLESSDSLVLIGPSVLGHTIKGSTDIPGWNLTLCNDRIKADDLKTDERNRENTLSPPTRF